MKQEKKVLDVWDDVNLTICHVSVYDFEFLIYF